MKPVILLLILLIRSALFAQADSTDHTIIPANQSTTERSIPLTHRFKRKTVELSVDRIFKVSVDSISYRGDVVQLADSVITFHAYFVEGAEQDSVYRFPLNSLSGISYYTAGNPERFFQKNRIPPSKAEEIVDDAFRVIGYIGGMSILATVISSSAGKKSYEGGSDITEKADPVLAQIGLISGLLNFAYYSVIILHRSFITNHYDLTEKWFIH
jgi:hypothetical protein